MARIPKKPLPQFSFWCSACEYWVGLVYKNRPEYDGMTGHHRNKRRMVLECEKCGCVHAERKQGARAGRAGRPTSQRSAASGPELLLGWNVPAC